MKVVPIGRILSSHGIKGEVKFRYYNEVQEDLSSYTSFLILRDGEYAELKPLRRRYGKGFFYILFEGVHDPDDARRLANQEVFVREEDLPELRGNEYYDYQLVGLEVRDHLHRPMGVVKSIFHTKKDDILVVEGKGEIFIPMNDEYIQSVRVDGGYITTTENAQSL